MKKLTALVMSLILLVCLSVSASAASSLAFLFPGYDVTSDDVFCYGKQVPAGGKLEVSVNSRVLKDTSLSTLKAERIPVTVYCLTTCSTSLPDRVVQQRNDLLLSLSKQMAAEDSMVLATFDSVLTESNSMAQKSARDTAIGAISGQDWRVNLYDAMSQAMKTLHANTSYNTSRCLIVISNGQDDSNSIAKSEDVLKQVREAGIPVYTVLLDSEASDKKISEKKISEQKQFAIESMGGSFYYPKLDKLSTSEIAQEIWNSVKGAAAIRIGVEELQEAAVDQQLLIRYSAANTRYEDTILVRAVDLPSAAVQGTADTSETTETLETTEPVNEEVQPEKKFPAALLICVICVLLAGAGAAVFFLMRKKAGSGAEEPAAVWPYDEVPEPEEQTDEESASDELLPTQQDLFPSGVTVPVLDRCHVYAVAIMHPEIFVDFYLTPNLETTFGRTDKADVILNAKDPQLSGCHGCFFWDGKMLLVQDRQSTNGTAVNGELCPENVWLRLEQGSILTAGKFDYRIKFGDEEKQE